MKHRIWKRLIQILVSVFVVMLLSGEMVGGSSVRAAGSQRSTSSGSLKLGVYPVASGSAQNPPIVVYGEGGGPTINLTLTLNAPYTGPGSAIMSRLTVTSATASSTITVALFKSSVNPLVFAGDVSQAAERMNMSFPMGDYSASATVNDIALSGPITSTLAFTITKSEWVVRCSLPTSLMPGQTVQLQFQASGLNSLYPFDWSQGVGSFALTGPQTVSYPNLQLTGTGSTATTTITLPSQHGYYGYSCSFSETEYYVASSITITRKDYVISEMLSLGGIQLYSDPQRLSSTQNTTLLVVLKPALGQPTPTGQFTIWFDGSQSNWITVGTNGSTSVLFPRLNAAAITPTSTLTVKYMGDDVYGPQQKTFTVTNPPIPGGTSGSGGSGGSGGTGGTAGKGTPTPPQATPSAGSGATPDTTSGNLPSTNHLDGSSKASAGLVNGGWVTLLLGVVALLLIGGAAGGLVFWRRRALASAAVAMRADHFSSPSVSSFHTRPPRNEEPRRTGVYWGNAASDDREW